MEQISLSFFENLVCAAGSLCVATITVHTYTRSRCCGYVKPFHFVTESDSFEISMLVGADYNLTSVQHHTIHGIGFTQAPGLSAFQA